MFARLDSIAAINHAAERVRELIAAHEEWLYARACGGAPSSVRRGEIEFRITHCALFLTCPSDEGATCWRINGWEWTEGKLLLEATRRMGAERATLELIPRASVSSLHALVSATRRARCRQLAQLALKVQPGQRLIRASLSVGARGGQPGRDARILLGTKSESIAVTGTVSLDEGRGPDAFLSSALLWFTRVSERARRAYIKSLWLIAQRDSVPTLSQRLALLREELRRVITLYELDEEWKCLTPVRRLEREELWLEPPARLRPQPALEMSESAAHIVAHAPEAIDVVRARHGETLRFHGLAFARVRRVLERERVWFGTDGARRRLLEESTRLDWEKLLRDLLEHRHPDGDRRHALYRAAPEAWLESLLRRDITRLDPGLRLAPLHAQFRTSANAKTAPRPVDLLALRHDGRLAVIELKVSPDRDHVLQGVDYWLRVEAHRRSGNIRRARLFGDAHIADEPPLVYLAAPTLSFHRAFNTLAHTIAPDLQLYRFDLNENWRTGVRVTRRCELA
ncbi:MAG: hypothetical protein JO360_12850 [Acidobacteria bacterium]|nr:hypothetical protein [Acidobacteriota bacterium]